MTRAQIGALGEDLAAKCLMDDGYRIVARNWRCRYGEIDIVAADGSAVVFVEVKTRTGEGFGTPAEAVTYAKLRRLRRLAGIWLAEQRAGWSDVRIDIVEVLLRGPERQVTHIVGVG